MFTWKTSHCILNCYLRAVCAYQYLFTVFYFSRAVANDLVIHVLANGVRSVRGARDHLALKDVFNYKSHPCDGIHMQPIATDPEAPNRAALL